MKYANDTFVKGLTREQVHSLALFFREHEDPGMDIYCLYRAKVADFVSFGGSVSDVLYLVGHGHHPPGDWMRYFHFEEDGSLRSVRAFTEGRSEFMSDNLREAVSA